MPEHDNWDSHWKLYADAASNNPAQQMRHGLILNLMRHSTVDERNVLDVGSGQGDLLVRLHRLIPSARLVGFELSESGVEMSRRKLPAGKFFPADIFDPPAQLRAFNDWATDAICSEVLEHVDSPVDFLKATRQYLRDEARLIVTVPGGPTSAFDRHIGHRQHFTRASIDRVLCDAGFEVTDIYLSGFPFFNLYRCVVIARGEKLAGDVDSRQTGFSGVFARVVMSLFRGLFKFNLMNSPFGWQVVAVARKQSLRG